MEKRCLCLKDLPIFDCVDQEVFSQVCRKAADKKHYRRGDVLFLQGDPADSLFLIKEGSFKLVRMNEDGKEAILHIAGKGEVLGETALFREGTQPAAAIALEDARVCALSRSRLEQIIRESPDLAMQVIFSLGNRLYTAWEQMTELRTGTTLEKVLNLLIRLAGEHGEPCPEGTRIRLHLTQQDIADFVGASRVMVAQSLKELAARKYISRKDKSFILKDRCF
ncbi:transcriptional regulator [Desulfocucumis palustris]|uniref:Transcriptional regulator n=1 Tax=Desulfocucumis palustris TaxID=1898651 RepID=A0A2L2X799_9FIRM|nr:Crp/Fnr family transcriptional regulator [Desulfocucumis palustris]GBF31948.1 transcriptional regulator [Desulfocucumis palustris]